MRSIECVVNIEVVQIAARKGLDNLLQSMETDAQSRKDAADLHNALGPPQLLCTRACVC